MLSTFSFAVDHLQCRDAAGIRRISRNRSWEPSRVVYNQYNEYNLADLE